MNSLSKVAEFTPCMFLLNPPGEMLSRLPHSQSRLLVMVLRQAQVNTMNAHLG